MRAAIFLLVFFSAHEASAAQRWAVPDPIVTPGAVNPAATAETICSPFARDRNRPTPPPWVTEFELSSYNIPSSSSADYVMDYLIPLSLGGANTVSNVWPQPRAEVEKKGELEAKALLRICTAAKTLPPEETADLLTNIQHYFAEDWTAAYSDYVGR